MLAWITPPVSGLRLSWLSCELSKSFCEFAAVGPAATYGNATSDVSWFTYTSTFCWVRRMSEIPSGIDSKR